MGIMLTISDKAIIGMSTITGHYTQTFLRLIVTLSSQYLEPDDVSSNDHSNALYQVTNGVNKSSTDVDVLFRAVFIFIIFMLLISLPEFWFLVTF